jgi:ribonuclease P protein component
MRGEPRDEPNSAFKRVVTVTGLDGFAQSRRLRKADEFSSVFRFRCVVSGAYLQAFARPNGLDYSRLGVVVAKKIVRRAVARNYIKRVVRESFRTGSQAVSGLDVVVRAQRPFDKDSFGEVVQELQRLYSQLGKCRARSSD